jgi:predicted phage terminase large subunit-like protein
MLDEDADLIATAGLDLAVYTSLMYPRFQMAKHHQVVVEALEDVEAGRCKRLMIFMPPRHGKSLIASTHFPAWYLGRNPEKYIICVTYGQSFADDFGRAVRNQWQDPLFGAVFPGVGLRRDSKASGRFSTTADGTYFSIGRGGALTGRGAHVLLIDDATKNMEEADSDAVRSEVRSLYQAAAYTRLQPGGAIVVIQTRWHQDDLAGWLLREHKHEGWRVIDMPAINAEGEALWPDAYPLDELMRIKRAQSARVWSALYQQQPVAAEGSIILREWWQPWTDTAPTAPDQIIISLDTAYTEKTQNDPSACGVWYQMAGRFQPIPNTKPGERVATPDLRSKMLLRFAWAERLQFNELLLKIIDTVEYFGIPGIPLRLLIEGKASGISIIQELRRRLPHLVIHQITPQGDKVSRAHAVTAMFEHDRVYAMARDSGYGPEFRPWAEMVIDECAAFPVGAHDDHVDQTTMALRHVRDQGIEFFAEDARPSRQTDRGSVF